MYDKPFILNIYQINILCLIPKLRKLKVENHFEKNGRTNVRSSQDVQS